MFRTSLAGEPEWPLLLAACSGGQRHRSLDELLQPLRSPLQWSALFDLAETHGVMPLLHEALGKVPAFIPAEQLAFLKNRHQTNLHKALMLSRELIRIVDALAAAGIDVMPYKGLALAECLYGDIALRQSGDIDLLVRASDLRRIREVLRALEYMPHLQLPEAQERAYLRSGYEFMFDGPAGPNLLEIQWALQPRFYAVDLDIEELFARAITVSVAGRAMKTPSFEDLFIVLSLHAAKHVWAKLIWICDLARIMSLEHLDWGQIWSRARSLRIVRILKTSMVLVDRMFGISIPSLKQEDAGDKQVQALANTIEASIFSGKAFEVESYAYFRLMMRLREKPIDRMKFLTRLILTPGPSEWAAVRLPSQLSSLYRIVRIGRLATRAVRS